ncbi:Autotransporter translocation and assembly protein TamB (TamB) (PDB:5VTG) [Commensalibacter papalotli (ex Botero et al. 2024)]|uniref:Autotransporter translocation and assembly protein TamB (TamB) (PDB:5VTG) n=1 Tax=Commensalibacter papalotli (ex Botero et al. 2024) TaxID=2972766 RepID=A0ABM9HLT7_9PROT|nr:Autotransporter translocation and assembly protein TamB (TamB) (PDB:5VTG) [Commensalibacter papalotli (ex Botero et al. 2024)]CAI3951356.1 Autotransporter translocation and assembly protein TamB (TamB) (PDB:5VTG) [Commensalibacter papalotli (ex Botero et al. 2024)]
MALVILKGINQVPSTLAHLKIKVVIPIRLALPLPQTGLGEAGVLGQGSLTNVNSNLFGVSATVGHSSSKSHTIKATMTDVGSTVQAGEKVNITAKNDINAKGSNISGNDVIFNAGYKTISSNNNFGVGASASIGIKERHRPALQAA